VHPFKSWSNDDTGVGQRGHHFRWFGKLNTRLAGLHENSSEADRPLNPEQILTVAC
jgi:hypothetical protein